MGNDTRCTELGYCGEHEWYGGGRVADEIVFHMSAVARGLDPYDEEKKTRPGSLLNNFFFYFFFWKILLLAIPSKYFRYIYCSIYTYILTCS